MSMGCLSIHAANVARKIRDQKEEKPAKVFLWMLLYVPGMIAGATGLISIVGGAFETNPRIHLIVWVFIGVAGTVGTVLAFAMCCMGMSSCIGLLGYFVVYGLMLGVFAALISDWVLAILANDLVGLPDSNAAPVYWTYFIAKRLPFFSF